MSNYKEFVIKDDTIDLHKIAISGQCFRWKSLGEQGYFVVTGGKAACFIQIDGGIRLVCLPEEIEYFKNYLDFGTDYRKITENLCPEDEYLCRAAEAGKGIRILCQDLWETIISFIISQRNNIPRITHSIDSLCEALGNKIVMSYEKDVMIGYTFPEPERLAEADLTPFKLGYRQPYIEQAARDVANGRINLAIFENMNENQAHDSLCQIKGVGTKVASCIQLFGLHQLSVFPVDTWIKKVEERHYEGHFPVDKYKDYAGVLQQYFFYYERLTEGRGK